MLFIRKLMNDYPLLSLKELLLKFPNEIKLYVKAWAKYNNTSLMRAFNVCVKWAYKAYKEEKEIYNYFNNLKGYKVSTTEEILDKKGVDLIVKSNKRLYFLQHKLQKTKIKFNSFNNLIALALQHNATPILVQKSNINPKEWKFLNLINRREINKLE